MLNSLKLISPIPVSVNHYLKPRGFVTYKYGKPKAMVTMYETADAKKYKKEFIKYVKQQVKIQKWNLVPNKTQHFYVDCVFYFGRIDQDANNYFKIMLDAITDTGLIWEDDNVVLERVNRIYYDSDKPRIEIEIKLVEYIGIFDSEDILENFENKCRNCKRYKRNCSILKKAIEGRIQDEIDNNFTCSKFNPS